MTRAATLFVASNDTHVRMFAPVIDALGSRVVDTPVLTLDAYYGQGAAAAAELAGIEAAELRRPAGPLPGGAFYRRSFVSAWRDVLHARQPLRAVLDGIEPATVVVGNDRGLLEKLILGEARLRGARTVLVQDGRLAPRPRPSTVAGRAARAARAAASASLSAVGLRELAASEYGGWGVDVICASGRHSARRLAERARGRSRVVVTGQPRYDDVREVHPVRPPRWDAVLFTTPFAHAGLGPAYQQRQESVAAALGRWAAQRDRTVVVKPHPREDPAPYVQAIGASRVVDTTPAELLAGTGVAIIGMSTLVEEAAMLQCPVVVPGAVIHGADFADVLPPEAVYPRGDTADALVALIERLDEPKLRETLLERQAAWVDGEVDWRSGPLAAERVATAIVEP